MKTCLIVSTNVIEVVYLVPGVRGLQDGSNQWGESESTCYSPDISKGGGQFGSEATEPGGCASGQDGPDLLGRETGELLPRSSDWCPGTMPT